MLSRKRIPQRHTSLSPSTEGPLTMVIQSLLTIVAAIVFSGLVFTGVLVFKDTDEADILARGNRFMVESKIAKAIDQYEDLIKRYPQSYEGHIALGKAYLALKQPEKAEKYFQLAAKLPRGDHEKLDVHLAQAQLFLSQQSFQEGAQLLQDSLAELPDVLSSSESGSMTSSSQTMSGTANPSQAKKRQDLIIAFIELHEQWAEHLSQQKDYDQAQEKYKIALEKVNDYATEKRLKQELIHTANLQADQLLEAKKPEQAVDVLKQALQYEYEAPTLIKIATIYKKGGDLDNAIVWYRKAYDAEPEQISLALSELLIKRGKELLKSGKRDDADAYFDEADKLLSSENTSPHLRYPVTIHDFNVAPGLNRGEKTLQPSCKATVQNASYRSLPFLKVKAAFWDKDTLLSEAELLPVTHENPLEPDGLPNSKRTVSLKADHPIAIDDLQGQAISIKLSVGYKEAHQPILWDLKSVQEIQIKTGESVPPTTRDTPNAPESAISRPKSATKKSSQQPIFSFLNNKPPEPELD